MFNSKKKTQYWADRNPHVTKITSNQHQFSLNVWVGIIGDFLIGPFFIPPRLTGIIYPIFLENSLPELMDDVPLAVRLRSWFMHDGTPAHFSLVAREHLDETYRIRWIGRDGPILWPPRSPDLNPLNFFLWGYLKSLVYTSEIESVEELQQRIVDGCDAIREREGFSHRVGESVVKRLQACIEQNGSHFDLIL
jgi:hypothetical protein